MLPIGVITQSTRACGFNDGDHVDAGVREAWDFATLNFQTVIAARPGMVSRADSAVQPGDPCFTDCDAGRCGRAGGVVQVKHSDGTVASYWHIEPEPGLKPMTNVDLGTALGTTDPIDCLDGGLLHFQVQQCAGLGCPLVPIVFADAKSAACGESPLSGNACY
jgi:hypothetical protein